MDTLNPASEFLEKYVVPAYEEWQQSPRNLRLAMNLASSLNNLVDHFWHSFSGTEPTRVFNQKNSTEFRTKLNNQNINFGLIRDVADSHKHLRLGRADRKITNADQVKIRKIGYGHAYGLSYGGGEQIVIEMDDSSTRYFSTTAREVFEYWKTELS